MELKRLQTALLAKVGERIAEYGFDAKPRGQSYYKRTPFGRLAFHLAFMKHQADFDTTADVAVRFDELEDLLNQYNTGLTKAERGQTFSLGAEIGNINEGKQKRWRVSGFDDLEDVSRSIADAFETVGKPYLDNYSSMESALGALSGDDRAAWLHSPIHDQRAKEALGLAFLLGDRERFRQIAAAKTEFLASRNDRGLQSFLQVTKDLELRFDKRR